MHAPQPEGHMAIERRKFLATLSGPAAIWPFRLHGLRLCWMIYYGTEGRQMGRAYERLGWLKTV
jgi:hypothetical protein